MSPEEVFNFPDSIVMWFNMSFSRLVCLGGGAEREEERQEVEVVVVVVVGGG